MGKMDVLEETNASLVTKRSTKVLLRNQKASRVTDQRVLVAGALALSQ